MSEYLDRNNNIIDEGFYTDGHDVYYIKEEADNLLVESPSRNMVNPSKRFTKGLVRIISTGSARRAAQFMLDKFNKVDRK